MLPRPHRERETERVLAVRIREGHGHVSHSLQTGEKEKNQSTGVRDEKGPNRTGPKKETRLLGRKKNKEGD